MIAWLWIWSPVLAAMGAIFVFSSLPYVPRLEVDPANYTGHFTAYAILSSLALRAFARARWSECTRRAAWRAVLLASMYGVTDEFHQSFVPGRMAAPEDWVADTVGAIAGAAVGLGLARIFTRRSQSRDV